ncbi:MAG: hypothetical protein ACYC8T_39065 [Myxococcaceae bacterium]
MGPTESGEEDITYSVVASPFLQGVAGAEYLGDSGFTFLGCVGYALLLTDNVHVHSGRPGFTQLRVLELSLKSGIVVELGLGYSF